MTDYEFDSRSMNDNAEGYFLTRDAMQWFYSHYLNDPSEGADPRVSPLRAPDLGGSSSRVRHHGRVRSVARPGRRVRRPRWPKRVRRCESRTYDGMFHGFLSMVEWIDAGKVAFDDAVAALSVAFEKA